MPMPPPKASTEGPRDRQVSHEIGQIVRALRANGPLAPDQVSAIVGAPYWDDGRYQQALAYAIADGHIVRTSDGLLTAT